jgi:hypothetical protein
LRLKSLTTCKMDVFKTLLLDTPDALNAITGTLQIANGGTGATSAAGARDNLLPDYAGNVGKVLTVNAGATDVEWTTDGAGTVTSVDVSGGTTGLTTSGGPVTSSGTITLAGTLAVANGGTGITSLGSGVATFLGTPSSANLAAAVTDETGTGALVFANSPTLVTPALGTPASGVVTNLTGTASININGTVGATTPSTVAATTIIASNTVSQDFNGAGGNSFTARYNSSNPRGGVYVQGGSGKVFFGENLVHSTANVFVADKSGTAWALADSGGSNVGLFYATGLTAGATAFDFSTTTGQILSVTSTGLAVTGALSATSEITLTRSANNNLTRITMTNADAGAAAQSLYLLANDTYTLGGLRSNSSTHARPNVLTFFNNAGNAEVEVGGSLIGTFSSTGLAVTGVSSATSTGTGAGFSIVRTGVSPSTFTMLNSGGEIIHEYNSVGYGFNISTARVASISSTGLAVTGTLSSTGAQSMMSGASTVSRSEYQGATSVAGSATSILPAGLGYGALCIVNGYQSGNQFADVVAVAGTTATALFSGTVSGSPAARTYTVVSNVLKLSMASGTYSVTAKQESLNAL